MHCPRGPCGRLVSLTTYAVESFVTGAGDGSSVLLLVAFESADHPVGGLLGRAAEIVGECGGSPGDDWHPSDAGDGTGGAASAMGQADRDGAGAWRRTFIRAPYLRDGLVRLGMVTETCETAVTWDGIEQLHETVTESVTKEMSRAGVDGGVVTCRITHAYPDGAAPYFTVLGLASGGDPGGRVAQWDEIKEVATEAVLGAGGTVTHHHAVGRDHRTGYGKEIPPLFASTLRAVKSVLDPAGVCNPGVLLRPEVPPAPPAPPAPLAR